MATLMNLEADTEVVTEAVFHRKIEFHLARKSFNGFGNINSNNGFKLITLNPKALESQSESRSSKKAERPDLAVIGFDSELSFKITFCRIGAGLRNLGNTCFLNSVLQCLTYTEPLAAYLQSGKHQNSCRTAGFCALCAIQKHVSRALQSTGRILEPKDLVSNLRCISRTFRNARQEDAHEYMVNLLESMHKCCLPSGVPSESASAYDKSLVHKIFGGQLRSQVKCMQCSYCSNKFDPFLDLSLEIVKADSLYKALAHFTAKEQLDGGAKQYQCEQCKQKVKALKQLTIYQAPHVLAIHLKRFGSHVQGQKINKNVYFGHTLDLKPFVTGSYDGELKYTLYGVLVHAGWSTHSGHYYCFVRTSSGMWYSLDDNRVVQVSEKSVLEQKAYMLFYVRDRTSFCAKKSVVDTTQKENMVMNATGNAAYANSKLVLRENAQNGLPKKISDGSSAVLSEKDAPITTAPKETPSKKPIDTTQKGNMVMNARGNATYLNFKSILRENAQNGLPEKISTSYSAALSEEDTQTTSTPKEASLKKIPSQNATETIAVDHVAPKMDPLSESSLIVQPMKDLAECHFSESTISVGHQVQSSSVAEASGSLNLSQPAKIVDINCHIKENGVVPMPSSRDNDDDANKNPSESADQPSSGEVVNMSGTNADTCNEGTNEIFCLESSIKSSIEEPQVRHSPMIGDTTIQVNLQASSGVPATTEGLLHGKSKRKRPTLKVNRKVFKCQVGRTQLSSNIIFGAVFDLQKKHKQRKSNSLQKKNPKKLLSGDNCLPSGPGSSTSSKSLHLPTAQCTQSKRKRVECGSDDKHVHNVNDCAVIPNDDIINDELRWRVRSNGTMVSSEKQPDKMESVSQENDISEDKRRELRQAGMMSILTRGLEEKTVARWSWDDTDVPLSEKVESGEVKTAQIGYIGDEWDEEYDRGKRKKIRDTKISYDGPNPFQLLASSGNKKAKTKTTKLNRPGSKNHPFRIP